MKKIEDAISSLFEKRQETYKLEKGYEICVKEHCKKGSENLYNSINTRIPPNSRKRLIRMIESYTDCIQQTLYSNNETIYRSGFKDCMTVILKALSF